MFFIFYFFYFFMYRVIFGRWFVLQRDVKQKAWSLEPLVAAEPVALGVAAFRALWELRVLSRWAPPQ